MIEVKVNENGVPCSPDWLGNHPELYAPDNWLPSDRIEVAGYRQILVWPLALRPDAGSTKEAVDDTAKRLIESKWKPVDDLLDHIAPKENDAQAALYAEFVYFHDFIQSVLYRKGTMEDESATLRLFRRTDVVSAEFELSEGETRRVYKPGVARCDLYLFRSGSAVLVLELDYGSPQTWIDGEPTPMTLADVLDVTDKVRRSYAPFYFDESHAGLAPESFAWRLADGRFFGAGPSTPLPLSEEIARLRAASGLDRTAPMFRHWRELLAPLRIAGYTDDSSGPVWRHIIDERVPVMSFVSLTGAGKALYDAAPKAFAGAADYAHRQALDMSVVSRADWIRLCAADRRGTDPMPYAPGFLRGFEDEACYDRHWPGPATDGAARYLFAGYHFAVVGAGWFFDTHIAEHFRRHYFQMALLLNMETASLLSLSSRVSHAVRDLRGADDKVKEDHFRKRIVDIESEFLEFIHEHRFTGLSNQLQPREMFAIWRRAMGVDAVFKDLKEEVDTAVGFVLAREQTRQADAANRLAGVAMVAAVLGLAFSLLGMNLLFDADTVGGILGVAEAKGWARAWGHLIPFGAVLATMAGLGLLLSKRIFGERNEASVDRVRRLLKGVAGFGLVSLIVGSLSLFPGIASLFHH